MAARLTVFPPDQPVQHFDLDPARQHLIGRSPDCDLHIPDTRLSRQHARLSAGEGRWILSDLGSKNGTLLIGRAPGETRLTAGDWISLGGLLCQYSEPDERQIEAELQQARTRWDETIDLSRRLNPSAGVDALLQQLLKTSLELAGAERGFVMLADSDGQLSVRSRMGAADQALDDKTGFQGSRSALERVIASHVPVVVCDAAADTLLGDRPSVVTGGIRALACLPLAVGEQLTGLVYLDSAMPGKVFTRLDVDILQAFASHAALVIGAALVRDELTELADELPRELGGAPMPESLLRRLQAALPRAEGLDRAGGEPQ